MDSPEPTASEAGGENDLPARVDELERALTEQRRTIETLQDEVRRLRSALAARSDGSDAPASSSSAPPGASGEPSPARHASGKDGDSIPAASTGATWLRRLGSWADLRSIDWLNYVGIGLFLFGVAFLFRYSVEQGWLVPTVRVGIGMVLGIVLLRTGLYLPRKRRRLRQVLLGGSGATFYITLFAAHQLYGLLASSTTFTGMGIVAAAMIGLGIRQEEAVLAVVGVLGGLGVPFLLPSDGGLSGLALYLCIVLAVACVVFWSRGWRSLIYTTVAGGWAAFFVAVVRATAADPSPSDQWALQAGLGVAWGLLAGTPVLRALLRRRAPDRWPVVSLPRWVRPLVGERRSAYGLISASPFLAMACTRLLWSAPDGIWPLVAGVGAAVYGGAYVGLRRVPLPGYAPAHGLVATVLAAYGLAEAFGGVALLVAWSVEAGLLLALSARVDEPTLRRVGHLLFTLVAATLAFRLTGEAGDAPPIVAGEALSELVVLGLGGVASAFVGLRPLRWGYRSAVLVGWRGWTAHELAPLPNGPGYTSLFWGATAAALLVAGARADRRPLQIGGLAVLGAFVAKLFLVDLASLPPLWRIALFLGFGAVFLGVSYLLPGLLPSRSTEASVRDG